MDMDRTEKLRELGMNEGDAYRHFGMWVEGYVLTNGESVRMTLDEWLDMEVEFERAVAEDMA